MKRRHSIEAETPPAPARDADVALSSALQRLASLRQQVHADWSAGIAELLAYTNDDDARVDGGHWTIAPPAHFIAPLRRAPQIVFARAAPPEPAPAPAPEPAASDVDTSWLALADAPLTLRGRLDVEAAPPLELRGRLDYEAPVEALPQLELRGRLEAETPVSDAFDDDVAVALARAADVARQEPAAEFEAPAVSAATTDVAALIAEDEPTPVGVGAFVNFFDVIVPETPPAPALQPVAVEPEPEDVTGYGAAAGVLAFAVAILDESQPTAVAPHTVVEEVVPPLAPGALVNLDAILALAAPAETPAPQVVAPVAAADEEPVFAVGAFAIVFDVIAAEVKTAAPADVQVDDDAPPESAYGAHAALLALLDATPAPAAPAHETRAFDPQSLVDDALADAFEAFLCARDPFETVWDADTIAFDADLPAAHLAACESALWNLPRRVPCIETFLATPNHETAVRLTRALRLRANMLEARAFAGNADFGALDAQVDPTMLWLSTDRDCVSFAPVNEDASFPDWSVGDDGLLTVTAPDITPPPRPAPPLITEAELDALFAHVDDARAHVLDDLGEESEWDEPYWADVDAYLAAETQAWRPEDLEYLGAPYDPANDILDIEILDEPVRVAATHFWMPGDPADMAVAGEGDDVFIVGGEADAAVILLEDGATHAMRTGAPARMDEVIVSLSHDPWTHVDAMSWTRLAALSGVSSVRVTQTPDEARRVVVAGVFAGALHADDVRLVRTDADGAEIDGPVLRLADPDPLLLADLDAA